MSHGDFAAICRNRLAEDKVHNFNNQIEILGMMRTIKRRVTDNNSVYICYQQLDETSEYLREYEIKRISLRSVITGKNTSKVTAA